MIAPVVSIGRRPHYVKFDNPGPNVPDGDGGWAPGWTPLNPPALFCEIKPLTAADTEYTLPGTILAIATHTVTTPYHPAVTTKTRLTYWDKDRHVDRTFHVRSVANRDERGAELVLFCAEAVE